MKKKSIYTGALLVALLSLTLFSCKNQKKISELSLPEDSTEETTTEETAEEETVDESEEKANTQQDPTEPVERVVVKNPTKEEKINGYFSAISTASSINLANTNIQETLALFDSPEAPVLVVFYKANGQPSYDEPTTIVKYLNYLKDTKSKPAKVEEMVMNDSGKIKELVLTK